MRNLWNKKWLSGQVFVRELRFDSPIIIQKLLRIKLLFGGDILRSTFEAKV